MRPDWDSLFMSVAMMFSMRSPDTSTRVGCVIVDPHNTMMSMGYNGWPRGIQAFENDDSRFQRPEKYMWFEHAERNAIYNACRNGTPLNNCSAYVTLLPCADCTRAIIQVGINKVIYDEASTEIMRSKVSTWEESHKVSMQMFSEAGIEIIPWSGSIVAPEGKVQSEIMKFC